MTISVSLTPDEIHLAASHALMRRHAAISGLRMDRMQGEKSTWDNEIQGAIAELAWCKLSKTYWSGASELRAKDAGDVEIRWTTHQNGGLIIYERDKDDARYVLARGREQIQFVGWLYGKEAKLKARVVHFGLLVDAELLTPMSCKTTPASPSPAPVDTSAIPEPA